MKTIIIPGFVFLILLGTVVILIANNAATAPITTEASVMRDITEKHAVQPETTAILDRFGLAAHPFNGAILHSTVLTDVSYNQTLHAKLDPASEWLTNEFDRQRDIQRFNAKAVGILTESQKDTTGKRHSAVYAPIARELNRLSKSKSEKRVLIVYSDLMENEADLSLYRQREFRLIQSDPDSLENIFEREVRLSRLDGIVVHLIHQPANAEADRAFRIVSEFYAKMLEAKGARVFIEANIQN